MNSVNVTVNNPPDTTPPTIRLTNPTGNPLISGTIVPSAYASDNIGVVGVQFQLNGVNLGSEVTAAPYRFAWDTTQVADGTYTLTAVARDAEGNRTASSPVSVTIDNTPPQVTDKTPASGATGVSTTAPHITATFSEPVQSGTIGFVLKDSAGHTLPASVAYDPSTNTVTFTPGGALEPSTTYTATVSGAQDLAGNPMAPVSWSFTTTSTVVNATIWSSTATPAVASVNDFSAQELGVKFTSDVAGYITGIRFYKGSGNTGTHVGHLWTQHRHAAGHRHLHRRDRLGLAAGQLRAAGGRSRPTPPTSPPTTRPPGNYAVNGGYFASSGVDAGVLHALPNSAPAATASYGAAGTFPTSTFNATNYWVDVVFSNTLVPTVASTTPAANATGVSTTSPNITVTFSKPVQPSTISFTLTDSNSNPVAATLAYNPSTNTATLTPSAALAALTTFTATVSGAQDTAGNTITPVTWSFTTAAPDTTPPTVTADDAGLGRHAGVARAERDGDVQRAGAVGHDLVHAHGRGRQSRRRDPDLQPVDQHRDADAVGAAGRLARRTRRRSSGRRTWPATPWPPSPGPSPPPRRITNVTIWSSTATPAVAAANDPSRQRTRRQVHRRHRRLHHRHPVLQGRRQHRHARRPPVDQHRHAAGHAPPSPTRPPRAGSRSPSPRRCRSRPTPPTWPPTTPPPATTPITARYFASLGGRQRACCTPCPTRRPAATACTLTGSGSFPTSTSNATNYWVDVVFSNALVPTVVDHRRPRRTPRGSRHGHDRDGDLQRGGADRHASRSRSRTRPATRWRRRSPDSHRPRRPDDRTVILTPHSPLAPFTTYTATVSGAEDTAGNTMAGPTTWSFTTVPRRHVHQCHHLEQHGDVPPSPSANDPSAQELGVKFTLRRRRLHHGHPVLQGRRQHRHARRPPLDAAPARCWPPPPSPARRPRAGSRSPSPSRWPIAANTTYVASYYAPAGHYASNGAYFASAGADNGVLHALSNGAAGGNGVYATAPSSFPTSTFNATNYWVDVVFSTNLTPTVTSHDTRGECHGGGHLLAHRDSTSARR